MVASPGGNPPSEASPDFGYEPCKGSRVAVGGECQMEEAAGLVLRSFPVLCNYAWSREPHILLLGGASSGPTMSAGLAQID
jgi:hypothetical protein